MVDVYYGRHHRGVALTRRISVPTLRSSSSSPLAGCRTEGRVVLDDRICDCLPGSGYTSMMLSKRCAVRASDSMSPRSEVTTAALLRRAASTTIASMGPTVSSHFWWRTPARFARDSSGTSTSQPSSNRVMFAARPPCHDSTTQRRWYDHCQDERSGGNPQRHRPRLQPISPTFRLQEHQVSGPTSVTVAHCMRGGERTCCLDGPASTVR